jgi:hypothetical protein
MPLPGGRWALVLSGVTLTADALSDLETRAAGLGAADVLVVPVPVTLGFTAADTTPDQL